MKPATSLVVTSIILSSDNIYPKATQMRSAQILQRQHVFLGETEKLLYLEILGPKRCTGKYVLFEAIQLCQNFALIPVN